MEDPIRAATYRDDRPFLYRQGRFLAVGFGGGWRPGGRRRFVRRGRDRCDAVKASLRNVSRTVLLCECPFGVSKGFRRMTGCLGRCRRNHGRVCSRNRLRRGGWMSHRRRRHGGRRCLLFGWRSRKPAAGGHWDCAKAFVLRLPKRGRRAGAGRRQSCLTSTPGNYGVQGNVN